MREILSLKRSWLPKEIFEENFETDICNVSNLVIYQIGILTREGFHDTEMSTQWQPGLKLNC